MLRNDRFLSRPLKLHWAGWETNTYQLQQAGWSLSAEQDIRDCSLRIAMRHERNFIYGITNKIPFDYMRAAEDWNEPSGLILPVAAMASRLEAQIHQTGAFCFQPIDAMPQFLTTERKSIEDFAAFAVPLIRTQEIIVPEESVSDLLAKILAKQQPAKTEYFKHQLRDNHGGFDIRPQQNFHAQILSFPTRAA